MRVDTRDLVSVTDLSQNLSRRISDAHEGRMTVILKNNQAVAALVGPEQIERLQDLDDREENLRLLSLTLARMATDSGERISLDDLASELGIDED